MILFAWPSNEELARLEVGESLVIDPVAKAFVESDGEFEMKNP